MTTSIDRFETACRAARRQLKANGHTLRIGAPRIRRSADRFFFSLALDARCTGCGGVLEVRKYMDGSHRIDSDMLAMECV